MRYSSGCTGEHLRSIRFTCCSDGDKKSLHTKVDLGHGFFCQAKVPDAEHLFVSIGYGFHLELTPTEAIDFAKKRIKLLEKRCTTLTDKIAEMNALIKVVLEALREIQRLPQLAPGEQATHETF
eukprot:m.150244 g.150244  ORF g.150244 m.150244 type:complete len:124 (-) comp16168_c1_seq2:1772-2143(-)